MPVQRLPLHEFGCTPPAYGMQAYNEPSGCIVVAESGIQAMGDLGTQPDCFLLGGDRRLDAVDDCHQEARVGSQVPHSKRLDSHNTQPLKWFWLLSVCKLSIPFISEKQVQISCTDP